jgi:hypothetical protein
MREVTTGISTEDYIEIVSGLKEGETVVVNSTSTDNMQNRERNMMIMGAPPAGSGGNFRVRTN